MNLNVENLFILENIIIGLFILFVILLYKYIDKKDKKFATKAEDIRNMIMSDVDVDIINNEIKELYKYTYDIKSVKYVEYLKRKVDLTYHK